MKCLNISKKKSARNPTTQLRELFNFFFFLDQTHTEMINY